MKLGLKLKLDDKPARRRCQQPWPGVVPHGGTAAPLASVGSCGGAVIVDVDECNAAAEALGLSDTSAYESTSEYYPPGCVFTGSSLYLYPATNDPTSNPCLSYEQCICAFTPPSPPEPPSPPDGAS